MKLFALLLFFSTSIGSATLLGSKHPIYFFKLGSEVLMCKSSDKNVICFGKNDDTGIIVRYTCTAVTPKKGFLKDCYTKPTINLS